VLAVEALTAAGDAFMFDESAPSHPVQRGLYDRVQSIVKRELEEIEFRYPDVIRNVAGYNLNRLVQPGSNMAHLLVGSEGTLAYSRRIKLKLSPLPVHKALGVCHFPTFRQAMDAAQYIVKLGPVAVEAVAMGAVARACVPAAAGAGKTD
jgi:FAD/FMN-containing dehydrogenase